jgi:hypothetical protein
MLELRDKLDTSVNGPEDPSAVLSAALSEDVRVTAAAGVGDG